jgi:hypothetical protein
MMDSASVLVLLLMAQVPPPVVTAPSAALEGQFESIRQRERLQLEAMVARLTRQGETDAVMAVRKWLGPPAPGDGATRFTPLPEVVSPAVRGLANVPARSPNQGSWRAEAQKTRDESAETLFALATRAATQEPRSFALAEKCLRAVLDRQPDHAEARRLLGYVPYEGGWITPFAKQQKRDGKVYHPTFGWVYQTWVPHLEKGELPGRGSAGPKVNTWLPAAQADALRTPFSRGWEISTEHFSIKTDVPLSEAISFGRQLEAFHELFFALLADLIPEDRLPLAQRFRAKSRVAEPHSDPHKVWYFADKQEYVDSLIQLKGPDIAKTLGVYDPPKVSTKRTPAYFYRDPGGQVAATATLYHEVSHQLLFESAGKTSYDRNVGNYWVFEGLGTYFETVEEEPGGALLVGGLVGPRLQEAWVRLIQNREFVPLERFVRLGEGQFTERNVIHLHYAQAMAVAVFLMQAQDGKYREGFVDYVRDAYRGKLGASGRSLQGHIGVPYKALDTEFLDYLGRMKAN